MLDITNKTSFENNLWVGKIDPTYSNTSKESRIRFITDIASISKGRLGIQEICNDCHAYLNDEDSNCQGETEICHEFEQSLYHNKRVKLFNRLLIESDGNPGTPFEFVPVVVYAQFESLNSIELCGYNILAENFFNDIVRYSYVELDNPDSGYDVLKIHTNLRTLIKAGISIDAIPFNTPDEVSGYDVVVAKTDLKTIVHVDRHRALVFNEESSRNKKYLNEVEFSYPSWWNDNYISQIKVKDKLVLEDLHCQVTNLKNMKPEEATGELPMRRIVKWVAGGWKQDPNTWNNLFAVRGDGTGTQNCTKIVIDNIKKIL